MTIDKQKYFLFEEHFWEYVNLIDNEDISTFVEKSLVLHSPDYFWTIPASNSGKYHNLDECIEGGLLLHTKRVINCALHIMRGLGWINNDDVKLSEKTLDYDIVIAASILHDLVKCGFVGRGRKHEDGRLSTDPLHPYYVREQLKYLKGCSYFDRIMEAIEGHYGPWSSVFCSVELQNAQSPVFIVYMADYIASRKISWFNI